MNEFKVGDVVYLKSGSPKMAITTIDKNSCRVAWIDSSGIEQVCSYPQEALTKEDPNYIPPESIIKTGF